jgi:hypothetical protein
VAQLSTALSAVPNPNESNRCKAIFLWIATNIRYDGSATQQTDPSEVLTSRTAVCAGYAELFSELCVALDIECEIVTGLAKSSDIEAGNHAWNAVRIGDTWHLTDVTWAANYHASGSGRPLPYFLNPPEEFIYTHFPTHSKLQFLPGKEWTRAEFDNAAWVNPDFFERGLSFGSHSLGVIPKQSPLRMWFGLSGGKSGVRLSAELRVSGAAIPGGTSAEILIQNGKVPGDQRWEMELRIPEKLPPNTQLFIFASADRLNQGMLSPVASYKIF